MDAETQKALLDADDPTSWDEPLEWRAECPSGMRRVRAVATELHAATAKRFDLDTQIQDASFYADLFLIESNSSGIRECVLNIRFSKFGRLFTFVPWSTQRDSALAVRARQIAGAHGFVFVDADSLQAPYSGQHAGFSERTWWTRFFDYI